MSLLDRKMSERTLGAEFSVSIATALALETICGLNPEVPIKGTLPIMEPELIYINVRTLIRNIYGSLETTIKHQVTEKQIINALVEEMSVIPNIVNTHSKGSVKVEYYACSFAGLSTEFPNAILKGVNTALQKDYFNIERDTIKLLLKEHDNILVDTYNVKILKPKGHTFLLTHLPIDLLWKSNFTELVLLESHTGKLKRYMEWNTKLSKGKDLLRLPFNKFTLQIFGDNNQLFTAQVSAVQKVVIALSEKYQWNPATTMDRINYGINQSEDPLVKSHLRKFI